MTTDPREEAEALVAEALTEIQNWASLMARGQLTQPRTAGRSIGKLTRTLSAALSQLSASRVGWRLVPEEPTEEMVKAGGACFGEVNDIIVFNAARTGGKGIERDPLPDAYRAMLKAAPEPPVEEEK